MALGVRMDCRECCRVRMRMRDARGSKVEELGLSIRVRGDRVRVVGFKVIGCKVRVQGDRVQG